MAALYVGPNMDGEQRERYVRWQGYRIAHMSFAINLFLGFAVASLAYVINLKIGAGETPKALPLDSIIIWWAASGGAGCLAVISKLLDYRYTALKIKDGGRCNAFMSKWCGRLTWGLFWAQVGTYAAGAGIFILGTISV